MNLLRQSRINPRRSAYSELFGTFDFNATPLAPIGTEAIIFQHCNNRTTSYSDHGNAGWYIGPCPNKYRNYKVYVTRTKGTKESNRVDLFPTKCWLPNIDIVDRLSAALEDLKQECNRYPHQPNSDSETSTPLNIAVKKMKELFGPIIVKALELLTPVSVPRVEPSSTSRPRVFATNGNTNSNK